MIVPRPVLRAYWAMHKAVDRISGGRLSTYRPTAKRLGVLFLTTTGRRSGEPRRNGLFFVESGQDLVVVASNAGAAADPGWWLNLRANPAAIVELRGRSIPVRAREAADDERAPLWAEFVRRDQKFAEYEQATGRRIAVVVLSREKRAGAKEPSQTAPRNGSAGPPVGP